MRTFRILFILICSLGAYCSLAQDKIVFKNGKKVDGKIVAINPHTITYRDTTANPSLVTVPKTDVLMAEYKSGSVYIFGNETPASTSTPTTPVYDRKQAWRDKEAGFKNNIIGIQPPDILFGRLTFTYERLFMDKMLGIVVPASLSFDPRALLGSYSSDTSAAKHKVYRGVGFITGLDVNMYFETRGHTKFFVGPRIRYGKDVRMGNVEATSVQFQTGFFSPGTGKMVSTVAVGFGFAQIMASAGNSINPKQAYPWFSLTYRLGFRL